ncbi:GGDEF domain-containing protein [Thalassospira alkalitolerans]|uniref:diguanylate cyclase n=1 Tax=Thalassospira alkalitolerans TaxID=1293890 RepID=A0A1Y2LCR3_9PROT|nr:diguanylate cyclase [Thalassospira alkalitolerans]OSQ47348.1 diguanylate cyclase [Thalassospira alkalitolerans]
MAVTGNEDENDLSGLKLGSSVASRQLKYSLIAATLLGLAITAFQIVNDYHWLDGVYHQANQRTVASGVPIVTEALLLSDPDMGKLAVSGMMVQRSIMKVMIQKTDGSTFYEESRPAGQIPTSKWAKKFFGGLQVLQVPLHDPHVEPARNIGRLIVDINPQVYVSVFMSRAAWSFLANMVFAVSMATVFATMSYFVLSQPIIRLANYIVKADPTDVEHPLEMPPMNKHDDEVQLLGSVTVGLFGMIRGQIGQLKRARDELQDANTNLEARVEMRTRELNDAMGKLEVLASTDPLTGLANRRVFMTRLEENISIWKRRDTPVSVVLIDIDRFKSFNDSYGHQAGDAVLVSLAERMRYSLRDFDIPARLGGEEFAVLLPGEEIEGAMILAERLRKVFEQDTVGFGGKHLNYAASFGVTSLPSLAGLAKLADNVAENITQLKPRENSDLADILYSVADEALYRAKDAGRNCCIMADPVRLTEHLDA